MNMDEMILEWKRHTDEQTVPADFADRVMAAVRHERTIVAATSPFQTRLGRLISTPGFKAALIGAGLCGGLLKFLSPIAFFLGLCVDAQGGIVSW